MTNGQASARLWGFVSSPFLLGGGRGHYQRVHKVLLEVQAKFKETHFLSHLSNINMCLGKKKRFLYSPLHHRSSAFWWMRWKCVCGRWRGGGCRRMAFALTSTCTGTNVDQRCYHMPGFIQALPKAQVDKCAPRRRHASEKWGRQRGIHYVNIKCGPEN